MAPDNTREIHAALHQLLTDLAAVESSVAAIARTLEQDDRLRERAERAETLERDKRHDILTKSLEALHNRLDGLHKRLDTLPKDAARESVETVETKIYELRKVRWEARQLDTSEPMPLPPNGYREPTGQHAAIARRDLDETKPYALHHTDGEKRSLDEWIGGAVVWGVKKGWPWAVTALSSGGLVELLHRLKVF